MRIALGLLVLIAICGMADAAGSDAADPKSAKPESSVTAKSDVSKPLNLGDYEASGAGLLDSEVNKGAKEKDEPVFVTALSFIFKLAVVLGLAYGTIYALKRFTGFKNVVGSSRRRIKIVENTSIGANRSLHLVEVGAKRLLVASTPSQISLLTELGAEDADCEQIATDSESPLPAVGGFGQQLSTFMGSRPGSADITGSIAQSIRGSSMFLQEKIMQIGRLRRSLKDG